MSNIFSSAVYPRNLKSVFFLEGGGGGRVAYLDQVASCTFDVHMQKVHFSSALFISNSYFAAELHFVLGCA